MENNIFELIDALAAAHKLTTDEIMQVLEKCFIEAWKTVYGEGYDLSLEIKDRQICLFRRVEIVSEITDVKTQIKGAKVGEIIKENLEIASLPRNIVLNIYDSIQKEIKNIHKIREFDTYKDEIDKLFRCQVKKIAGRTIILNISNQYEGIIPSYFCNQRERFSVGEFVQCRLAEVKYNLSDYQLIFERKTKEFIELLMIEFIPEVANSTVKIVNIAREAGSCCKILVNSEGSVNAVGACLGFGAKRRLEIVKELKGEKIDFIKYHQNVINQIKECFKFKDINIYKINIIDEENIEIVIPDDKVAEAIGRGGQNIFLTSKLLQKKLSIISVADFLVKEEERIRELAKDFEPFDISIDEAVQILTKYRHIQHALHDETFEEDLRNRLKKYIKHQEEIERDEFIEAGGDPEFFMSTENIPSYVYFQLLENNICTFQDVAQFNSGEDLHEKTSIDLDACIILIENYKSKFEVASEIEEY